MLGILLTCAALAACGSDRSRNAPPVDDQGTGDPQEGEGEPQEGEGEPQEGEGEPAQEGEGEGEPAAAFCGPYEERPDGPPDDEAPLDENPLICDPPCTGRNICVPPGECDNVCLAPVDCPTDVMRTVRRPDGTTFRMDAYEASRPDAGEDQPGCNRNGRSCSQPGVRPWDEISWHEAKAACEKVEKRLCTLEEWRIACHSACGFEYPYGNEFDSSACNGFGSNPEGSDFWQTGRRKKCSTPDWIYDLVGNAREWTSTEAEDEPGSYAVVGGSPRDESRSFFACAGDDYKTESPDNKPVFVGFRCCAD